MSVLSQQFIALEDIININEGENARITWSQMMQRYLAERRRELKFLRAHYVWYTEVRKVKSLKIL